MLRLIICLCIAIAAVNAQAPVQYGVIGQEQLHAKFAEVIKCQPSDQRAVGYIFFSKEHPIDEASYYYAKEALSYFKKEKVCFIVVDLNCYGGALFPAIKIADLLQKIDVNSKIPCIAYINDFAIGSGAMLAYACRFIAVNENSLMGGQLPNQKIKIQSTPDHLMPYILNEYSSLATTFGRDPLIAEAMADIRMIVVERQGHLLGFYNRLDLASDGNTEDKILATDSEWLSLDAKQLLRFGIADFSVSANNGIIQAGDVFSSLALEQEPYLNKFSQLKLLVYSSILINILLFLSKPIVAAFLLFCVLVGLYLQIKKPKISKITLGLGSAIAALVIASLGIQALSWIELMFLCLGITIIFLDCFFTEGSQSICLLGGLLVLFSLFMMMLPGFEKFSLLDFEAFSFAAGSLASRVLYLSFGILLACIVIVYLELKVFKKVSLAKKTAPKDVVVQDKSTQQQLPQIGSCGMSYSSLRPRGQVLIDDHLYDAMSFDEKVILKKKKIVVVGFKQDVLMVQEITG